MGATVPIGGADRSGSRSSGFVLLPLFPIVGWRYFRKVPTGILEHVMPCEANQVAMPMRIRSLHFGCEMN